MVDPSRLLRWIRHSREDIGRTYLQTQRNNPCMEDYPENRWSLKTITIILHITGDPRTQCTIIRLCTHRGNHWSTLIKEAASRRSRVIFTAEWAADGLNCNSRRPGVYIERPVAASRFSSLSGHPRRTTICAWCLLEITSYASDYFLTDWVTQLMRSMPFEVGPFLSDWVIHHQPDLVVLFMSTGDGSDGWYQEWYCTYKFYGPCLPSKMSTWIPFVYLGLLQNWFIRHLLPLIMTSAKNNEKNTTQSGFEKKIMESFEWFAHYSQKKVFLETDTEFSRTKLTFMGI